MLSDMAKAWTPELSAAEKIMRPIVVYLFLAVMLRIFGKRELAQLNPFDLVVLLTLSNTVQNAIIGADNSITGGLIGATTMLVVNYLVVRFVFQHRRLDQIMMGEAVTLIEKGQVQRSALAKELLSEAELTIAAHRNGYKCLSDIDKAVLEPGGVFYFEGKGEKPETRHHKELLRRFDELQRQIDALRKPH